MDILRKETGAIDREFNVTSSVPVKIQDLPFNKNVQPFSHQLSLCPQTSKPTHMRAMGINIPITSPPDDACIAFWQAGQPSRAETMPAHRHDWDVLRSFSEAPAIKPMYITIVCALCSIEEMM